uniref:cytochrome b n=1 Tax=Bregmatothrips sinensis TaxID=3045418 RepID=UPI0030DE224F
MKLHKNKIYKIIETSLMNLPSPMNISLFWNLGSLLGISLIIQIISGLLLAMHYTPNTSLAFESVIYICRDTNLGWVMRIMHANGASFFFMFMFIHIGRGIYYDSFTMINTWIMGTTIFLLSMASAFLGYVLPWGQMSFWGATVITNLMSVIPYLGKNLVYWIWGGFSVENATLNRFFVFHFFLPLMITMLVFLHLMFLHVSGSSNPMGLKSSTFKIPFNPYFTMKDLMGFMIFFLLILYMICYKPYMLSDPDNFILANPMVTPLHIKPEWYFLFAYAILRSITNKLGGVIGLLMSILILMFLPMKKKMFKGSTFFINKQITFWNLMTVFSMLTWIGSRPVEEPFIFIGQILTILYFLIFIIFMNKH